MTRLEKILEGDHLDLLMEWAENEEVEMPEDLIVYVQQIEMARGFFYQAQSPHQITKKLRVHFPYLSDAQAQSRMQDAVEYFYLNRQLKNDAWREILFEKQMQAAQAAVLSATKPEHYKLASDIWKAAHAMKNLHLADEKELPIEFYEKKIQYFSLDPEMVGLPEAPKKQELSAMIDSFLCDENEKVRLKQDANLKPKEILEYAREKKEPRE